jgi:hypothetical protein
MARQQLLHPALEFVHQRPADKMPLFLVLDSVGR